MTMTKWVDRLELRRASVSLEEFESGSRSESEINEGMKELLIRLWELGYDTGEFSDGEFDEQGMAKDLVNGIPYISIKWERFNQEVWQQVVEMMTTYNTLLSDSYLKLFHEPYGKVVIEVVPNDLEMLVPVLSGLYIYRVPYNTKLDKNHELEATFYFWAGNQDWIDYVLKLINKHIDQRMTKE